MTVAPGFAARVVRWQQVHGRKHLPWQGTRDPYRVWLSEIMLQQTQVATVLGYYDRFLARFPDVASLAAADLDQVLALWGGLGYYSRARNLHRCAQMVMDQHAGQFPADAGRLAELPGIGRSTAAAIAAFCFGQRVAILDANVKRVLTRALGFGGDLASSAEERRLWERATDLLPPAGDAMARYTQGLMDLGATVCIPRKPLCLLCPLVAHCVALRAGEPERFPVRTRKPRRSSERWWLLIARDALGAVWLERREASGIWGGLHCFPVFQEQESVATFMAARDTTSAGKTVALPAFVHVLTHKDLHLHPVLVDLVREPAGLEGRWVAASDWALLGVPTPVRKLLDTLPPLKTGRPVPGDV